MAKTITVRLRPETRADLESVKVHPRETLDQVIERLIEKARNGKKAAGVA